MTDGTECPPRGARDAAAQHPASHPTAYELCNVFGTPTGRRVVLADGETLPAAPKGWFWKPIGT